MKKKKSKFPHESEKKLRRIFDYNAQKIFDKYSEDEEIDFSFTKSEKEKIIKDLTTVAIITNKNIFENWRTLTDVELKRTDLKGAKYWIRENYLRVNKMNEVFKTQLNKTREQNFKSTLKKFNASLDNRFDKLLRGEISKTDIDKLLTELKGFYNSNKDVRKLIGELERVRKLNKDDIKKLEIWSKRRNELWARNETGNLYANQLKDLWLENNIEKYRWQTMHDNRVRMEHVEKDGKIFTVDEDILPGQDFGCRCWAEPIK